MKKKLYLFFIAFSTTIILNSCGGKKSLSAAKEQYDKKEYKSAIDNFEGVYTDVPKKEKAQIAFDVAESYRHNNEYSKAERWYDKAIKAGYGAPAILKKAEMQKCQENYTDAIISFNQYLKEVPNDDEAKLQKLGADSALIWKELKSRYHVENLRKVNSEASDYGPALAKDQFVFTSDREDGVSKKQFAWTGGQMSDLYQAPIAKRTETIGTPELLQGTTNSEINDGAPVVNDKGNVMYYTQCGGMDPKNPYSTCQIYQSSKKGKDWDAGVRLSFCDTSHYYGHPTLSADGTKLYFTSDMPGGVGGYDIYVVNITKRGKEFGDPINLGPEVNTVGDEVFPYITEKGVLYFSSNYLVGMGGFDIFTTKGSGNEWSTPKNLRSPMNTGGDDFAITMKDATEEKGFFSSNRKGGKGNDDIYEFYMTPLILTLSGIARDCNTKQPIKNAIITFKAENGQPITIIADSRGYYKQILAPETKYDIIAEKSDEFYQPSGRFFPSTKGIEISTDLIQDLDLCKQPIDFNVRGIYYDLDKANIRPDAQKILDDSVLTILKRFPTIVLELGSHTDCRASSEYNRKLAQRRADSAVAYLVSRGIDSARLIAKGYGEDDLFLKKCACDLTDEGNKICSEEEHQLNRRTTIKILRTDYSSAAMRTQDSLEQIKINEQIKKQKEQTKKKEEDLKLTPEQLAEREKQKILDEKKNAREEQVRKRQEEQDKKRKEREDAVKKRQEEMQKKQEQRKKEMEEKRKEQQKK